MPRSARVAPGGMVFHVLNRANNRETIFESDGDYRAFLRVICDSLKKKPMRILSYCLMPNHWHMLLWPRNDGELGEFLQVLTTMHVRRWRLHRESVGCGHVYQGTYKSFPVESDEHFYSVARYVERNALRANLVDQAEDWRWSSLWQRLAIAADCEQFPRLDDWPLPIPRNWATIVNRPETQSELDALRMSLQRGRPYGSSLWQEYTAKKLGLESTLRDRGRPRKSATAM